MRFAVLFALGLCSIGCAGATRVAEEPTPPPGPAKPPTVGEQRAFDRVLAEFARHDRAGDWTEATCKSVANAFVKAARSRAEAHYDAGLAYQRCNRQDAAQKAFQAALSLDPGLARAQAQVVLHRFEKSHDVDAAITELDRIIRAGRFQNVEGLVALAALQMERKRDVADADGKNDMERAKKNLQRALAIDDSYMSAMNQLAIFYLEQAKSRTGGPRRGGLVAAAGTKSAANTQQLDLAALVASQGIRRNPSYAPLHNTAGLIQVELRNFNSAVKSFATARRLDPKFFEAHMNYAAVNLGFRGFEEAEKAYRAALRVRPREYEARLGLALAIRGRIRPGDPDRRAKEVETELALARKLAPNRAETYYNAAILTQEFQAKGDEKSMVPTLKKAASLYGDFIAKAGSDPAMADAVKRAKERQKDIEDTLLFIEQGKKTN
jgi:tetratricopeptide (TPR) repeat protein